ncbi:AAA family ATPase [Methylibium rhizosphaerae]|uniref:AAA family ATPase n=1 Tax=Methylibium rhizosphaerae TaxID=2570323 RepID=UPI0011265005|nr:AAA family ATPase [Methylibium rhizosphaerae]
MKPLRLTLKGFTGIRDGLGRDELTLDFESLAAGAQLVALVGPNGSGKTTIIDNAQPYRLMPSRATSASVGGFSYYDHLCAPEGCKDLEWMHEGRRFRSQLVFRMNGARRTEAFLHEWKDGRWVPVVMPDGTRSDGKTDTYDRCVDGLLGSPETFFTSAFHAQNRRQLSAYRPSEVKGLLVELLGLEQIRATGQQAARVASQLQQALEERRAAVARHRAMEQSVQQLCGMVEDAQARIRSSAERKAAAQASLQGAQQQLAAREAERVAAAGVETLRQSLQAQIGELARRRTTLVGAHARLVDDLKARRERAAHALRAAEESAAAARARLQRDLTAAQALLSRQDAIRAAVERLPALAEQEQAARTALRTAEQTGEHCARTRQRLQVIAANRQGLEREAGAAALRAQQLRERFQLTQEVPCTGTDLQGTCKLLADAREARALQPSADLKIEQVRQEVARLDTERDGLERELAGIGDAAAQVRQARASLDTVIEQRRVANADAALAESVRQAQDRLNGIAAEAMEIGQREQAAQTSAREECARCDAAEREASDRHAGEVTELDAALTRLTQQLAGLSRPFDDGRRAAAELEAARARQALGEAEAAHTAAVTQHAELVGRLRSSAAHLSEGQTAVNAVTHLETELALWTALTKALGNDGVIALCIDDAGPTLASLTNELLLGCYGPRFTVSIATQVETAKKDLKEGFDVLVFDAETGASKSVAMMSGGERVWIDEALTRAIAVYLSQSAGRRYQTLFSDEADGALDPERKRMFMAMKREVLRVGGYEQEIFVSQTAELWSLADKVIDVGQFRTVPKGQARTLTI